MNRLSGLILAFSLAFLVFFIGPPLLSMQFGPYPLMKVGDLFDLLTPLMLLPLYWLLFKAGGDSPSGSGATLVFLVLAAFWMEGQGMHLSANSIGHLTKGLEGHDVYSLTGFYDEVLSHYIWHFGVMLLSALIVFQQWRNSPGQGPVPLWPQILAGVIYGFTFFLIIVEGATAPLGVPFAAIMTLLGLVFWRKKLMEQPVLAFFFVGYLVALILVAGWAIYWGGLPEFSQVGIID